MYRAITKDHYNICIFVSTIDYFDYIFKIVKKSIEYWKEKNIPHIEVYANKKSYDEGYSIGFSNYSDIIILKTDINCSPQHCHEIIIDKNIEQELKERNVYSTTFHYQPNISEQVFEYFSWDKICEIDMRCLE